jgi:hypothetical protein
MLTSCRARTLIGIRRKLSSHENRQWWNATGGLMIRKLGSGEYRLYSRKLDPKTGKRRNLGTFGSKSAALKHERDVQYFKRH